MFCPLRRCAALAPVVCALAFAACDDSSGLTVVSSDGWLDPPVMDFGERALDVTHELSTTLRNPGVGDQTVTDVQFDPPLDVYAARVAMGGTLRGAFLGSGRALPLRILYAPREEVRYDTKMLIVFGDFAVALDLRGSGHRVAQAEVRVAPDALTFPLTEIGRDIVTTVEIQNVGEERGRLREVRLGSNNAFAEPGAQPFYVTLEGTQTPLRDRDLDPRQTVRADVHFKPRAAGMNADSVSFVMDNGKKTSLPLSGLAVVAGEIRCDPPRVDFGEVNRGQAVDVDVRCFAIGGLFTFSRAAFTTGSADRFVVTSGTPSGTVVPENVSITLRVRFNAEGLPAAHEGVLEVYAAHGGKTSVMVTGSVRPPPAPEVALSAAMTWDTVSTDVDLHLVRNGEEPYDPLNDCFFRYKNPDWGTGGLAADDPFLDRDDVDGMGPEEVNLTTPADRSYDFYVHYYRAPAVTPSMATIVLKTRGTILLERSATLTRCGDLWHVARVTFAGGGPPRVDVVDQVTDDRRQANCP